ncbi:helix-turn-helix domain-containing protein [Spirillospora sp. NPDC046719]
MTQQIIDNVPEQGIGPAPFETLRRASEAAVLTCLCGLAGGQADRVTRDGVELVRDCVRRGIPLDRVLRGVRVGHACLHRALRDAAPGRQMPAPLAEMLFEQVDRLSGELAEVYVAERNRSEVSEEAARWRMIEAIIAGEQSDPVAAERVLGYAPNRHHVAVILWRQGSRDGGGHPARLAADLADACGGDELLQVSGHAAAVWAWMGFDVRPRRLPWPSHLPDGWRAAAGPPSYGVAGMRRSHLAARRAASIAAAQPTAAGVCDYRDVRTACLLTGDAEQARWYMLETLGALAAEDGWTEQLRNTLRCYLASGRSLKATAQQLEVARNTVAYRVKRAEELLGARTPMDPLETRLALEIIRFPGVLTPRPGASSGATNDGPDRLRHMYFKTGLLP